MVSLSPAFAPSTWEEDKTGLSLKIQILRLKLRDKLNTYFEPLITTRLNGQMCQTITCMLLVMNVLYNLKHTYPSTFSVRSRTFVSYTTCLGRLICLSFNKSIGVRSVSDKSYKNKIKSHVITFGCCFSYILFSYE